MENWYERMSLTEQKVEIGIGTSDKYSTWNFAGYINAPENITHDYEAWRSFKESSSGLTAPAWRYREEQHAGE